MIKSARVMKKAVAHLLPFIEEEKESVGGEAQEESNAGGDTAGVHKISTFCPCDSNDCVFVSRSENIVVTSPGGQNLI